MSEFESNTRIRVDEYADKARELYKQTPEWKEYEERSKRWTKADSDRINTGIMDIFKGFGVIRTDDPSAVEAQTLVKKLQAFITDNLYTCSNEVLAGLGAMYGAGGDYTANIDNAAGEGTALFVQKAIEAYCKK